MVILVTDYIEYMTQIDLTSYDFDSVNVFKQGWIGLDLEYIETVYFKECSTKEFIGRFRMFKEGTNMWIELARLETKAGAATAGVRRIKTHQHR